MAETTPAVRGGPDRAGPIEMDYWKSYVTLHHVLACELSYSLIYDNIRPDKVWDALATVGLTQLPNRFFLIQVDDYYNASSKLHITQEFFQKTALINLLRAQMARMELTGFMANLVGLDKIICFLCCSEWEDDQAERRLMEVAATFQAVVRAKSAYTISVCISRRCQRLVDFSRMYPGMDLALSKSYFSGKEYRFILERDSLDEAEGDRAEPDLNQFYPAVLAAFARHNPEQLEQTFQAMLQTMLDARMRPRRANMHMAHMIQRLVDYCVQCGVPKARIQRQGDKAMARLLACDFIADARRCFREFYEQATQLLEESGAGDENAFKLPVAAYIAAHYAQPIRVGDLADLMGFSEGHFARLFRREFGMTLVQYVTQYRVRRSCELLSDTGIPVEQIAEQVGIGSYSYFCTCFKRICGLSPGAYRAEAERRRKAREMDQDFEK